MQSSVGLDFCQVSIGILWETEFKFHFPRLHPDLGSCVACFVIQSFLFSFYRGFYLAGGKQEIMVNLGSDLFSD